MVVERWHGRRRERTARHIRETAEALRPLLAGEKAAYEGELVRTDGYRLRLPAPQTSLTVAAFGEATVRVAAQVADRMVLNLVTPELVARMAGRAHPGWRRGSWPPSTRRRRRTRSLRAASFPIWQQRDTPTCSPQPGSATSWRRRAAACTRRSCWSRLPPELAARVGLVGTEEEARRRAAEYFDAGLDELVLVPATAGDDAGDAPELPSDTGVTRQFARR